MSTKKKLACFLLALVFAILIFTALNTQSQAAWNYVYHYTVKNDTLWLISKKYSVPLSAIIESNPDIENPDLIYIGQQIAIPLDYQNDSTGNASENNGQNGNNSTNNNVVVQQPDVQTPTTSTPSTNSSSSVDSHISECLSQINQVRAKNGLSALTLNSQLNAIALERCKEMYNTGVFSHTLPYSGTPFEHMKANGVTYWKAGENIASGFSTSQVTSLVNAWVASPGHYANIVGDYNQCGLAYYNGYWCNLFIKN